VTIPPRLGWPHRPPSLVLLLKSREMIHHAASLCCFFRHLGLTLRSMSPPASMKSTGDCFFSFFSPELLNLCLVCEYALFHLPTSTGTTRVAKPTPFSPPIVFFPHFQIRLGLKYTSFFHPSRPLPTLCFFRRFPVTCKGLSPRPLTGRSHRNLHYQS